MRPDRRGRQADIARHAAEPQPEDTHRRTVRGQIDPTQIMGTSLFSLDEAGAQPGWLEVPRGQEQPETDEYGISNFVYGARRPFHAERLWTRLDLDDGILAGVIRSKGFLWIASRHDYAYSWSQAGVSVQLEPAGLWWSAAPDEEWSEDIPENAELLADIRSEFEGPHGDRRQEIVFLASGWIGRSSSRCWKTAY